MYGHKLQTKIIQNKNDFKILQFINFTFNF